MPLDLSSTTQPATAATAAAAAAGTMKQKVSDADLSAVCKSVDANAARQVGMVTGADAQVREALLLAPD